MFEHSFHGNQIGVSVICTYLRDVIANPSFLPRSNSRFFDELTMPGRIDFCFNEFRSWTDAKPDDDKDDKNNKIEEDDVFLAIEEYYLTGKAEQIKFLVREGNKKKEHESKAGRTIKKIATNYPKLWDLIDAINYFEEYRSRPGEKSVTVLNNLLKRVEKIRHDTEQLNKKEESLYDLYNFELLASKLCKGVEMTYNCGEIREQAKKFEEDGDILSAAALYLDILRTPNIYSISESINNGDVNTSECSAFKSEAYVWCKTYINDIKEQYQDQINNGHDALIQNNINLAIQELIIAHEIDHGLSKYKITFENDTTIFDGYDTLNIPKHLVAAEIVRDIHSEFTNVFNAGLVSQKYIDTIINGAIELHFLPGDNEWKGWFSESKYRLGKYTSPNDELISEKVSSILIQTYEKYEDYIDSIEFYFSGSADYTPYSSKTNVQIYQPEYLQIKDSVCWCKGPTQGYMPKYDFKLLCVGGENGKKQSDNSVDVLTPSKQKNLALAFLRAYHRKTNILKLLGNKIPPEIIVTNLCGRVHDLRGEEYRYVDMRIKIKVKDL
jgi:hypothetical protein